MFDGAELARFVEQAPAGSRSTTTKRGCSPSAPARSIEAMSRSHLRGIVVTLGAARLRALAARREARRSRASPRPRCVDPTGCGDAFRARDALRPRERLAARATAPRLGNRLGALKIASRGGQNHVLDRTLAGRLNGRRLKLADRPPKSPSWTFVRQALMAAIPSRPHRLGRDLGCLPLVVRQEAHGRGAPPAARATRVALFSQQQTQQARRQIEQLSGRARVASAERAETQACVAGRRSKRRCRRASGGRARLGSLAGRAGARLRRHPGPARLGLAPRRPGPVAAGSSRLSPAANAIAIRSCQTDLPVGVVAIKSPAEAGLDDRRRAPVRACCPSETARPLAG